MNTPDTSPTARDYFQARIGQPMHDSPSPLGRWLGGVLHAVDDDGLTIEFTVREEMTNPAGLLHGGIISAIMDDVIGATVYSLGRPDFYVTVNLNVDFLASARVGELVTGRSRLVRAGRNVINAEGELSNASGKLLARATTNLVKVESSRG